MVENLVAEILFDEISNIHWVEFYIGGVRFSTDLMTIEKAIKVGIQLNHVFDKYKKD